MGLFHDLRHDGELIRHLTAHGRTARATVTAVVDAGVRVGGVPVLDLDLDVDVPGQCVYTVSHRQAVPDEVRPAVDRGGEFAARVDPERPSVLVLLF